MSATKQFIWLLIASSSSKLAELMSGFDFIQEGLMLGDSQKMPCMGPLQEHPLVYSVVLHKTQPLGSLAWFWPNLGNMATRVLSCYSTSGAATAPALGLTKLPIQPFRLVSALVVSALRPSTCQVQLHQWVAVALKGGQDEQCFRLEERSKHHGFFWNRS